VSTRARALLLVGMLSVLAVMWALSFASKRLERVAAGVMPLEPRRFERLTAVAAGTGGTQENHLRLGPCLVVGLGEELLLVDAGRAAAEALRRAGIPVAQPAALLLTSLLPENTLGLDDWLWGVTLAGGGPRRVIGPAGTRELVLGLRAARRAGTQAGAASFGVEAEPPLEVEEAGAGFETRVGALALRASEQRGGPLPTLVWRIEGGGISVVASSAGFDPEALVGAARGADLWVHDALHGASLDEAVAAGGTNAEALAREGALHTRLEDVGGLATRAGVRRLALMRLRPPPVWDFQYVRIVAPSYLGEVLFPEDGDEIRL
jgi:ribonuclease BN (tRNA processing enzyme)